MNELKLENGMPVIQGIVWGVLTDDWKTPDITPLSEVVTDEQYSDTRTVLFSTPEGYVYVKMEIVGTEGRNNEGYPNPAQD